MAKLEIDEKAMKSADRLRQQLLRTDSSGNRIYDDNIIDELVPFLLLSVAASGADIELPPEAIQILDEFARRIGCQPDDTDERRVKRVEEYYEKNPIPKEIKHEIESFLREEMATGPENAGNALASLMGMPATKHVPNQPAPEGAVKGGVLAQMRVNDSLKK